MDINELWIDDELTKGGDIHFGVYDMNSNIGFSLSEEEVKQLIEHLQKVLKNGN